MSNKKKVLVVGDGILDTYIYGTATRISPEAPVPVVLCDRSKTTLGGACNVALNALAQGVRVGVIGVVGQDSDASVMEDRLGVCGIWCHLIRHPQFRTSLKTRVMADEQQILRMDEEKIPVLHRADQEPLTLEITKEVERVLDEVGVLVLSDYSKGTLRPDVARYLIKIANEARIPVIVDPKGVNWDHYRHATYIAPNWEEARGYVTWAHSRPDWFGREDSAASTYYLAEMIAERLDVKHVLITRGALGVSWYHAPNNPCSGTHCHIPAKVQHVYDVTGAGDTLVGVLAASLLLGFSPELAIRRANTAAGIAVSKHGTAVVTAEELSNIGSASRISKLVLTATATEAAARARKAGQRVVFTNGCFDVLHNGHVSLLQHAKAQGELLIVGLNSDATINKLKGDDRPIRMFEDRVGMLSALQVVDMVVGFDEDTPEALIRKIRPDVLVKGHAYQGSSIPGADFVVANGGRLYLAPILEGYGTTQEIEKIREHRVVEKVS